MVGKKKKGIIYKIEINDDIYIGSTTAKLSERQSLHNRELKKKTERLLYKTCIKNDIDYIELIAIEIVEFDDIIELRIIEEEYRIKYNATLNSYRCYLTEEQRLEIIKEYNKEYYEINKEEIAIQKKEYRQNNKEQIAEYNKEYWELNKEIIAARMKEYQQNNKEIIAAKRKKKRIRNKNWEKFIKFLLK